MTKVTAHAGCEKTRAGSLENIIIAIDNTVDFIEVDLRAYNDTIYLAHDEIKNSTNLVTLEKVISMVKDKNIFLNCDVKDVTACQKIIDELQKNNFIDKVVFTGGVDIALLTLNNVKYYLNLEDTELLSPLNFPKILELYTLHSKNKNFVGFNIDYTWVDKKCLEFFYKNTINVCLWTVDNHTMIDMFIDKIENMTTNEIRYAVSRRLKSI